MSRFFIERPVFAWVIAIAIMVLGGLAIFTLPVAQYPNIAPPAIVITANYPGASAQTLENTVTQVIEQQLTGIDGMLYFSSTSSAAGTATITVTFMPGTDPNIDQVQVQNKLQLATPRLPQEVNSLGVTVAKQQSNFLMVVALYDTSGTYSTVDIGDVMASSLQLPLSRITGVGNVQLFGSQYAMRIWLDPLKLRNFNLMPSDVAAAIQAQNVQIAAGSIGALPAISGQQINATVTSQSLLRTPKQFRNIILATTASGGVVRLGDVARVELGADNYGMISRLNGKPAAGMAIQLAPGANALTVEQAVIAKTQSLMKSVPPQLKLTFPVDQTKFVRLSIHDVIITLVEAIALVVAVMFLFLQNWRTTIIPAITIPVVLLGTFGLLAAFGYSINTLTMFALVLAIGLLVDDAIVVVENVERIMSEEGLSPHEATVKSMDEIQSALIGIAMVLSAVFLPMAFISGVSGIIYRQFSVTIVSAMVLSIFIALVLTPTLCSTILKPVDKRSESHGRFFRWFNNRFDRSTAAYRRGLDRVLASPFRPVLIYGAIVGLLVLLFVKLPTGFLPTEDQGYLFVQFTLPQGATADRTLAVGKQIEHYFLTKQKKNVDDLFVAAGFSFAGSGQNTGMAFVHLTDWSKRPGAANSAQGIALAAMRGLSQVRDAQIFALVPPAIQGLGQSQGFDVMLEDRGDHNYAWLEQQQNQFMGAAMRNPDLQAVRPNNLPDIPQLHVDIDNLKASMLGLSLANVDSTLQAAWAGTFVNDFINKGLVKRVYIEGDAKFRMLPSDLGQWGVRNSSGTMVPFSDFSTTSWQVGPASLQRYNGFPAIELLGSAAPGVSSGTAMQDVVNIIDRLGSGVSYEWTALSYQEALTGSQAPFLYAMSILVVFLSLAALYESWSLPFSVLLVIPLGVVGALSAAFLRGLTNDVFFQVGLLTTIGLSAKNAILIVEFAEAAVRRGEAALRAAQEAARLRLRPIIMTSLAFIAGVTPLAVSTGAGAASQNDIGTGVIGGMITATILAIFLVPMFFLLVQRYLVRETPSTKPDSGAH